MFTRTIEQIIDRGNRRVALEEISKSIRHVCESELVWEFETRNCSKHYYRNIVVDFA
jgi:hypothetical protein